MKFATCLLLAVVCLGSVALSEGGSIAKRKIGSRNNLLEGSIAKRKIGSSNLAKKGSVAREVPGSVEAQGSVVSVAKRQTFLQTVNAQLAYAVDVLISFLHYGEQLAQQALFGLANAVSAFADSVREYVALVGAAGTQALNNVIALGQQVMATIQAWCFSGFIPLPNSFTQGFAAWTAQINYVVLPQFCGLLGIPYYPPFVPGSGGGSPEPTPYPEPAM